MNLELNHLSLPLFVTSQLEVLTTLERNLLAELAFRTFHPQNNLFGGLGLWIENSWFIETTWEQYCLSLPFS